MAHVVDEALQHVAIQRKGATAALAAELSHGTHGVRVVRDGNAPVLRRLAPDTRDLGHAPLGRQALEGAVHRRAAHGLAPGAQALAHLVDGEVAVAAGTHERGDDPALPRVVPLPRHGRTPSVSSPERHGSRLIRNRIPIRNYHHGSAADNRVHRIRTSGRGGRVADQSKIVIQRKRPAFRRAFKQRSLPDKGSSKVAYSSTSSN